MCFILMFTLSVAAFHLIRIIYAWYINYKKYYYYFYNNYYYNYYYNYCI
jgi:hypothetical protein